MIQAVITDKERVELKRGELLHLTRQVPQEASWCSSNGLYNPANWKLTTVGVEDRIKQILLSCV